MPALVQLARQAADVLAGNSHWMTWNLMLAAVPVLLALVLFRAGRRRTFAWWAGLAAFVVFLPNAPYVLTDVIHLYGDVRYVRADAVLTFTVLPQYLAFFAAGVAAYVWSLTRLRRYLDSVGRAGWWPATGAVLHVLSATGVVLGRYPRLNSWDILRPAAVIEAFAALHPLRAGLLVAIGTCALFLLYEVLSRVALGLVLVWRTTRAGTRTA